MFANTTSSAAALISERRTVAGVPVLIVRPSAGICRSLVLLSHGFLSNKETIAADLKAVELAGRGYFVVAMDNRGHGERCEGSPASEPPSFAKPTSLLRIRTLIKETADDIPPLLDALAQDPSLELREVAMVGVSMGGFVAWRAMTMDPRIRVAVPVIASPYWEDIPGRVPLALTCVGEAQAYAAQHNPALRRDRFGSQAILTLLGADDPHLDSAKAATFVESLRALYTHQPERLMAKIYPGIGHQLTDSMRAEIVDWINRHANQTAPMPQNPPSENIAALTYPLPCAPPTAVVRTRSFVVPGSPAEVFPLLCPKREEEWIPGWKADTLYAPSNVSSEDAVFRTRFPDGTPLVWVVSRYEPSHRIEFTCVSPEAVVMRLKLQVEAVGTNSRIDFTRTFISIGERGPAVIRAMTEESFMARTDELRALLTAHLTGSDAPRFASDSTRRGAPFAHDRVIR